jgi:hypothetical protein
MRKRKTYVVSLVLLGKHSSKAGIGMKFGAAGSLVGRVRPTPFAEEDGTVAIIVTVIAASLGRRSAWKSAWRTSAFVPFRMADAELACRGATTP